MNRNDRIVCSGGSRISRRGRGPRGGGGMDSRGSYILKILYIEMKESGPLLRGGGVRWTRPLDPPMVWLVFLFKFKKSNNSYIHSRSNFLDFGRFSSL